jgi:hypothetical protein
MKRSVARTWKHLARERLKDQRPTIPLGPKFLALYRGRRGQGPRPPTRWAEQSVVDKGTRAPSFEVAGRAILVVVKRRLSYRKS